MSGVPSQVTQLLGQWEAGDEEALRRLLPFIYNELHRLAHQQLRRERPNHTLQTTALVNEAYSQLAQQGPGKRFHNRAHICAVSAQLMRQILIQ